MGQIEELAGYGYVTQFKLPPDSLDPKLLDRYLAGECDDQEIAAIERALADNPDTRLAFDAFLQKLNVDVDEPSALETLESLERMHAKIRVSRGMTERYHQRTMVQSGKLEVSPSLVDNTSNTYHIPSLDIEQNIGTTKIGALAGKRPLGWIPWLPQSRSLLSAAAGLCLVVLAAASVSYVTRNHATSVEDIGAEYTTSVAQLTPVTLPDGSRIILAPDSRLRLSKKFGSTNRDVYLEGKASFTVVQDAKRPFTVITKTTNVQVLGTEFVVERYDHEHRVQVAVKTGRVYITKSASALSSPTMTGIQSTSPAFAEVLNAGELFEIEDGGTPIVERGSNVDATFAWTTGALVFVGTPVSKFIADVERWYGVRFLFDGEPTLPNTLRGERVTTTLNRIPLSVVVAELSVLLQVRVTVDTAVMPRAIDTP